MTSSASTPDPAAVPVAGSAVVVEFDLDRDGDPAPDGPRPAHLGRWLGAAALIAVIVAGAGMLRGPEPDPEAKPPPTVVGGHLAVPVALSLPAEAVATADGSYVGVQFPAGGVVLVTVPTEVADPSGARTPLPPDPASWLAGHPAVFVSRVREVTIGGATAIQLDYRRSRAPVPPSRFARLPLFCGWRSEADPDAIGAEPVRSPSRTCTQITAEARVRATFVPLDGRTVLVEAVWRVDDTVTGRMPAQLQRSYTALLAGLTPAVSAS